MRQRPRNRSESGVYHVGNRGARRLPIFADDRDRHRFLEILAAAVERFGIEVLGYCLLGNHYHLLVKAKHERLQQAMHYIGTTYVRYFNRRYGMDGSLCVERYWSDPVEDDTRLLTVARYIERNALDIRPGRPVERYRWSSLGAVIGRRNRPTFLEPDLVLDTFGGGPKQWLSFITTPLPSDRPTTGAGPAPRVAPDLDATHVRAVVQETVLRAVEGTETTPRIESMINQVTLVLCSELVPADGDELADVCGLANARVAYSIRYRARNRLMTDPGFASIVASARGVLTRNAA